MQSASRALPLTTLAYNEDDDGDDEEDDPTPPNILRFVPEDTSACKMMSC